MLLGEAIEQLRRATVSVRSGRGAMGSGVVWGSRGRIVTNAHVVAPARASGDQVELEFWDGRRVRASVAERSRRFDLARLSLHDASAEASAAVGLTPAQIGDSTRLRPGEVVVAVGNPLGFTGAASSGVVHSATNSAWVVSQLRLAPGNSGGPLANARGEVVGINTMVYGGLALSVPAEAVDAFLARDGRRRAAADDPELGVQVRAMRWNNRLAFLVLEVANGSAAARASILPGDLLVGADGSPFQGLGDLAVAIARADTAAKPLVLEFVRGAERHRIRSVVVAPLPAAAAA